MGGGRGGGKERERKRGRGGRAEGVEGEGGGNEGEECNQKRGYIHVHVELYILFKQVSPSLYRYVHMQSGQPVVKQPSPLLSRSGPSPSPQPSPILPHTPSQTSIQTNGSASGASLTASKYMYSVCVV